MVAASLAVSALWCTPAPAGPLVKDGDIVAVVGDSITEGRTYSVLIEDYLLMCQPAKVRVLQFGWSGETVAGLNSRISDFARMKPSVATLCYGMNDGHYTKITDGIRSEFREGLLKGVQSLQQAGTKVVVGSPGCVDANAFARPTITAADYNVNLAALKDEAAGVARTTGSPFADVYSPMIDAMAKAKERYGPAYSIAGTDGVHPKFNGGLVMAYAFLKGLGFDGNVGTLYVDLNARTAKTFGGHKFVKAEGDAFTFESTQYPMCFSTDLADKDGAFKALDFVPFNAELNRLTLTAAGPAKRYRVRWGKESAEFTAEQLKAGVNLAAEFPVNPFVPAFMDVQKKVYDKQGSDVLLLKQLLHSTNAAHKLLPGHDDDLDKVAAAIPDAQAKLAAAVAAAVVPVTHTLTFEPID